MSIRETGPEIGLVTEQSGQKKAALLSISGKF